MRRLLLLKIMMLKMMEMVFNDTDHSINGK